MSSSDRIAAADPIDDVAQPSLEEADEARRDTIPVPSIGPSPPREPRDTVPTPPPDDGAPLPDLSIPRHRPLPTF